MHPQSESPVLHARNRRYIAVSYPTPRFVYIVDTPAYPPRPLGNNVMSAQMLEVSLLKVGTVLRLERMRGQWSNGEGQQHMRTPPAPPAHPPPPPDRVV